MSFPASASAASQANYASSGSGNSLFQAAMDSLQYTQQQQQQQQLEEHQQQQQQQREQQQQQRRQQLQQRRPPPPPAQQVSTKALAITSCATGGTPPPPLMGSTIVLANDSALHCFGGRLENRDLTNCHYVLDVETGLWEAIHPAPSSTESGSSSAYMNAPYNSSSLSEYSQNAGPMGAAMSGSSAPLPYSRRHTMDRLDLDPNAVYPPPRYFHTLNVFGTSLILFGGMGRVDEDDKELEGGADIKDFESTTSSGQATLAALNDLWVFDMITQRWQQKHPSASAHAPKPRWAHMATILDHYLVVIGGTDTVKAYVEDACVLDLHNWEWVASIHHIGQCGSYRTVAATGPSKQASLTAEPSAPSFPSAYASSPQTSVNLARPLTDSGPVDAMGSISMVLSGRISAPSSRTSSSIKEDDTNDMSTFQSSSQQKQMGRLMSGELTPAFKSGRDAPAIYLYSNYNFHKLQRDFKVITPHYTEPAVTGANNRDSSQPQQLPPPSFSIAEKTMALNVMGNDLPPGLRFPQGHVYRNHLILTGTLIVPGKAPTLGIYAFNLAHHKWERLATDHMLETGSWNRTLLHPATGTLLIFGNHKTDAEMDYANRIQHHDHLMMINLQAYGLYDRPVPSIPHGAQELGQDLLSHPSMSDMTVASALGTVFGANSTMLAARWPEFATLLLSPPYVTPLILILPVPDEIVPLFLQYLYTGALPLSITAGMADYLLILARRYELNGLYALTMDILHQTVHRHPIRIYSTALIAGEMGLQARAVGLAMQRIPTKRMSTPRLLTASPVPSYQPGATEGKQLPPVPSTATAAAPATAPAPASPATTAVSNMMSGRSSGISLARSHSGRVSATAPFTQTHRRALSNQSRDSLSTDGGFIAEGIVQQYSNQQRVMLQNKIQEDPDEVRQERPDHFHQQQQPMFLSSPEPRLPPPRPIRSPPLLATGTSGGYINSGSGGMVGAGVGFASGVSGFSGSLSPTTLHQGSSFYHTSYSSPLSPTYQQQQQQYGYDEFGQDERTVQAKKRLQLQLQQDLEAQAQLPYHQQQQLHNQQHQEYLMQQQLIFEQQHMREQEMLLLEQHRLQHQRYLQKQQKLQNQRQQAAAPNSAAVLDALDYHFGGGIKSGGGSGRNQSGDAPGALDSRSSAGSNKSDDKKKKDDKKDKKNKQKPPLNG
ncbi:hypothetical protein BGZ98_008681, partial [Dissophora globulifera]